MIDYLKEIHSSKVNNNLENNRYLVIHSGIEISMGLFLIPPGNS